MKQYLYPNNLRATATLWLWGLRDFVIIAVAALLSIIGLVQLGWMLPPVLTMCYAFATIRMDETTILDYLFYCIRYFITTQQIYFWR